MHLAKNLAIGIVLLSALALAGCSKNANPTTNDAGSCDPNTDPTCVVVECADDVDCGPVAQWQCIDQKCVVSCATKADCLTHTAKFGAGDPAPVPGCDSGLGCNCDARACVPQACTSDDECTGQVCKSGKCVPADNALDHCEITPGYQVAHLNQPLKYTVVAYSKDGAPLLLGANAFTWTAVGTALEQVSGSTFKGKTDTAGVAQESVKAAAKGVECTAKAMVFGDVPNGEVRVVVVDERTGRPVTGATVVVNNVTISETNIGGVFSSSVGSGNIEVGVFHSDFSYVSILGTTARDFYIPLRRNPTDKRGGYKGTFTNFPSSQIAFGIAASSIPGTLTELQFNVLLGASEPASIPVPSASNPTPVDLPTGIMLGINGSNARTGYKVQGEAGVCANEAKTLAGLCGTRTAWGLMGQLPYDAVGKFISGASSGQMPSMGSVLSTVAPYFKRFSSSVVRDVEFDLVDQLSGVPDYTKFATRDMTADVALTVKQVVQVPDLKPGMDAAIILAGTLVPGRGIVPLGLTAASDTNDVITVPNGKLIGIEDDGSGKTHDDSKLPLRLAPNHHGTEGSRYTVATLAISSSLTTPSGAYGLSGLVTFADKLPYGGNISYADPFMEVKENNTYDYRAGTFTNPQMADGANFQRLVFINPDDARWYIYFNPGSTFTVPVPPNDMPDRTFSCSGTGQCNPANRTKASSPAAKRSPYMMQTFKLASGADPAKVLTWGEATVENLNEYTTGLTVFGPAFDVAFTEPAKCAKGCDVPATQAFKLKIAGFKVGGGGTYKVALIDSSNGGEMATVTATGDYEVSASFASPLSVGSHTLVARVLDAQSNPVDPAVSTTVTVNVK